MATSGDDLEKMLEQTMRESNPCRKCEAAITFEVGAQEAKQIGITDKVLMCPKCHAVYEADVTSAGVKLAADVTSKYAAQLKAGGKFADPGIDTIQGGAKESGKVEILSLLPDEVRALLGSALSPKVDAWESKLNEKGRSNLNKLLDELGPGGRDNFWTVLSGLTEAEAANMAITLNVANPETIRNLATFFKLSPPGEFLKALHNPTPVNELDDTQAAAGALILALLCFVGAFFCLSDPGWRTGSLALGVLMAIAAVVFFVVGLAKKTK